MDTNCFMGYLRNRPQHTFVFRKLKRYLFVLNKYFNSTNLQTNVLKSNVALRLLEIERGLGFMMAKTMLEEENTSKFLGINIDQGLTRSSQSMLYMLNYHLAFAFLGHWPTISKYSATEYGVLLLHLSPLSKLLSAYARSIFRRFLRQWIWRMANICSRYSYRPYFLN